MNSTPILFPTVLFLTVYSDPAPSLAMHPTVGLGRPGSGLTSHSTYALPAHFIQCLIGCVFPLRPAIGTPTKNHLGCWTGFFKQVIFGEDNLTLINTQHALCNESLALSRNPLCSKFMAPRAPQYYKSLRSVKTTRFSATLGATVELFILLCSIFPNLFKKRMA